LSKFSVASYGFSWGG